MASESVSPAIVAARLRCRRLHSDVPIGRLIVYTTTQTLPLVLKVGLVPEFPVCAIPVRAEDYYGPRGRGLRQVTKKDSMGGKHPFVLRRPSYVLHIC